MVAMVIMPRLMAGCQWHRLMPKAHWFLHEVMFRVLNYGMLVDVFSGSLMLNVIVQMLLLL